MLYFSLKTYCNAISNYVSVIAVGDSRVGKTSIINRFVHDEFPYIPVICNLCLDFDTRFVSFYHT